MIKITGNCNDFLQAYNSAHSGNDSSRDSKNKEEPLVDKKQDDSTSFGQRHATSHVRYNSLVDKSNKYNTQKKLKFKNGKIAQNSYGNGRTALAKVDTNAAQFANNSAPYYHSALVKSPSLYQKNSEDYKEGSEGTGVLNLSYPNFQGAQGLENKENINLLESNNSLEEPLEDVPPLTTMILNNRNCKSPVTPSIRFNLRHIVGIDKQKEVVAQNENFGERPK